MNPQLKKQIVHLLLFLAIFAFVGLFFYTGEYLDNILLGEKTVHRTRLMIYLTRWLPWTFLCPIVIVLGRRFSFRQKKWRSSLLIHSAGAIAIAFIHLILAYLFICLTAHIQAEAVQSLAGSSRF